MGRSARFAEKNRSELFGDIPGKAREKETESRQYFNAVLATDEILTTRLRGLHSRLNDRIDSALGYSPENCQFVAR